MFSSTRQIVQFGAGVVACLVSAGVAAADERVTLTGGADGTGQNYKWTVRNNSKSRIVEVEFPHFHADLFTVPDPAVWRQECTNMATAGSKTSHLPGVCRAWVEDQKRGIGRGLSADFGMRIGRAGAQRRTGDVTVRFADGTSAVAIGIELPTKPTSGEQYVMAVGLGAILLILAATQMRRKRSAAAPDHPTIPPDDGQ
jgi:hypothetical protein